LLEFEGEIGGVEQIKVENVAGAQGVGTAQEGSPAVGGKLEVWRAGGPDKGLMAAVSEKVGAGNPAIGAGFVHHSAEGPGEAQLVEQPVVPGDEFGKPCEAGLGRPGDARQGCARVAPQGFSGGKAVEEIDAIGERILNFRCGGD